ncbi:hypothetical protein [Insolitispirillum peregrinum]|uniref:hypothetical protein n=1 Tax=Insolitispirillum peregrinum TaxID=80876 RepID=UPI00361E1A3A
MSKAPRKIISFSPDILYRIRLWKDGQETKMSESEAVRLLLDFALDHIDQKNTGKTMNAESDPDKYLF